MRSYVNDLDRHFDDEYVQIFKNVQKNTCGAIRGIKDLFEGYMFTYTGGNRDILSFLELITGAMEEITQGLYKGEDRDYLYQELRELEYFAVLSHFSSFWGIFQPKIRSEYKQQQGLNILVNLNKYRDMEYSLLLYREAIIACKNKIKQLEKKLPNKNSECEDDEY